MKICRITDAFPPPWTGLNPGPFELSMAQHRNKIEIDVITKYNRGSEDLDKNLGITIHRVKAQSHLFDIIALIKFLKLHRQKKFDLIHSHGYSVILIFLLRKVLKIDIPIVVSIHSLRKAQKHILKDLFYKNKSFFSRLIEQELLRERICINNADILLPVSYGLKDELIKYFNIKRDKIIKIGNGVKFKKFTSDDQLKIKELKKKIAADKVILFAGVLNGRKNEIALFKALNKLNVNSSFKLVIIGKGSEIHYNRKIIEELGITDKVMFVDYVSYDEIRYYYSIADVFILPSLYEGLPKVVLEAMAYANPILASDIPGNNELVFDDKNGFVFEPTDYLKLKSLLEKILNDDALSKRLGNNSKSIVDKYYTWDIVSDNCMKAYKMLLK